MRIEVRARAARWAVGVMCSGLALAFALPALAAGAPASADSREELRKSTVEAAESGRYIVVLNEPALASYRGGKPSLAAPERAAGSERLNARGTASLAYVEYLRDQQRAFESKLGGLLGRSPQVSMRMQHAINALVVELSPEDAKRVADLPEVRLLSPERLLDLHTDVGPALIGAEPI
ncbi:MAG: S8 family serine peptidase, partial [Aquimonas sp.]